MKKQSPEKIIKTAHLWMKEYDQMGRVVNPETKEKFLEFEKIVENGGQLSSGQLKELEKVAKKIEVGATRLNV